MRLTLGWTSLPQLPVGTTASVLPLCQPPFNTQVLQHFPQKPPPASALHVWRTLWMIWGQGPSGFLSSFWFSLLTSLHSCPPRLLRVPNPSASICRVGCSFVQHRWGCWGQLPGALLKNCRRPLFSPFVLTPPSVLLSVMWMWSAPQEGPSCEPKGAWALQEHVESPYQLWTGFLCIFTGERTKLLCCFKHRHFGFLFLTVEPCPL